MNDACHSSFFCNIFHSMLPPPTCSPFHTNNKRIIEITRHSTTSTKKNKEKKNTWLFYVLLCETHSKIVKQSNVILSCLTSIHLKTLIFRSVVRTGVWIKLYYLSYLGPEHLFSLAKLHFFLWKGSGKKRKVKNGVWGENLYCKRASVLSVNISWICVFVSNAVTMFTINIATGISFSWLVSRKLYPSFMLNGVSVAALATYR